MTAPNLPEPISRYFAADRHGGEALVECFTHQAVVKDEGQIHQGQAAIAAWKAAATSQYAYTVEPVELERAGGRHLLKGLVRGSFPGSPVELWFEFVLERGKIASLEIRP